MNTILQTMLHDFVTPYPQSGQPAQLELTVGTHDPCRDTSKFRVSDAGKCRLIRFLKRQGKPTSQEIPAGVMLQMQVGNIIHTYIERAVHDTGCLLASEDKLEDEHRIGHFDMILTEPGGSKIVMYDIKTISSKKTFYMAKYNEGADEQHQYQLITYFQMLPVAKMKDIDDLRIAYVTRDTLDIKEVPVIYDDMEDRVEEDWAKLIVAWDKQEPPLANPNAWECQYCPYHNACDHAVSPG